MRYLMLALANCLIFITAGVVHRFSIRALNIPFDHAVMYWGSFIGVVFVITLLLLPIFNKQLSAV